MITNLYQNGINSKVISSIIQTFEMFVKMKIVCVLCVVGFFGLRISGESLKQGHAIQILEPDGNHSFRLNNESLNILQNEEIKDHHVVVFSIAGKFREGKSFLLNFFLKYLYAKVLINDYNNHD